MNHGSLALGADIGGTAIKLGLLEASLGIVRQTEVPTPAGADLATLVDALLAGLLGLAGSDSSLRDLPFGIGCAGIVDPRARTIARSPNLPGLRDAPLATEVAKRTGRMPILLNDANAFVLAETRLGGARGASSVVGLTLGTGVGGGLLLGGRLWEGAHGFAGEPGHAPVALDGPTCACGQRGCLEALIGTRAIVDRYAARAGVLSAGLTPEEISRRAKAGDADARDTWVETGRLLGLGLIGLAHLLDPEVFVIGGGISRSASLFLPRAVEEMERGLLHPAHLRPRVVCAELGPAAGWIGAALASKESL